MQLSEELALSYYKTVAELNEDHMIHLVQHTETKKFGVKKRLKVYNLEVYQSLQDHPVRNTPQIYMIVEDSSGLIVIEEYIPGDTLQDILDKNGNLSELSVLNLLIQLCQIVSELHHRIPPVIHRDIKPSNLILSSDGILKLLDFNAAKFEGKKQTRDTCLIGTTGYAAPEQYGFGASTQQTDLYSMGVLMNVLLNGKIPTEKIAEGQLKEVIKKCTELNPTDRFSSVDEFADVLIQIRDEINVSAGEKPTLSWRRFLPPGFRTGSFFHMLIASFGYGYIFFIEIPSNPRTQVFADQILNQVITTVMFLVIVFFSADYAGIQSYLPFVRCKNNRFWHLISVILYDIFWFFFFILLLVILETLFF